MYGDKSIFKFDFRDVDKWCIVLCKLMPKNSVIFRTKDGTRYKSVASSSGFEGTLNKMTEDGVSGTITAETSTNINYILFWNALPDFIPTKIDISGATKYTRNISDLIANFLPKGIDKHEMLIGVNLDRGRPIGTPDSIHLDQPEILVNMIHKKRPIRKAYFSPKTKTLVLSFKDGASMTVTSFGMSNMTGFTLDLSDEDELGRSIDSGEDRGDKKQSIYFPEVTEDVKTWKKSNDLDPDKILSMRY